MSYLYFKCSFEEYEDHAINPPWWMGYGYRNFMKMEMVWCLIPFNYLVRVIRLGWCYARITWPIERRTKGELQAEIKLQRRLIQKLQAKK